MFMLGIAFIFLCLRFHRLVSAYRFKYDFARYISGIILEASLHRFGEVSLRGFLVFLLL